MKSSSIKSGFCKCEKIVRTIFGDIYVVLSFKNYIQ